MGCTQGVGYQGYLTCNGKMLPFLTGNITERVEINASQSVHGIGAGSVNPVSRDQHNFSIGRKIIDGDVAVEVFGGSGNYSQAFQEMLKRTIGSSATDMSDVCNGFTVAAPLIFSPAGGSELFLPSTSASQPKALIQGCDLRANPGGNVGATFKIISAGADWANPASGSPGPNAPTSSAWSFETPGTTDDSNPIPYYASNFNCTGSGESSLAARILDWSISINNNAQPLYAINGVNSPADIFLGTRVVTGTFSYYSTDGIFVETLSHGAVITLTFGSITLTLPFVAFGPSPVPSPGPNQIVVRNVEFTAFAKSAVLPEIYQS